jgi:teichoic acid transport system permease protein
MLHLGQTQAEPTDRSSNMAETAVAGPDAGMSLAQLAATHGLSVSGARPPVRVYVKRLWAYRYFIHAFAQGRLMVAFANTQLGRLWQVLTPITNAAVYFFIFGVILNTRHGVANFIAYLCTGVFIFNFTSVVFNQSVKAISSYLGLVRALHFPRASLPLSLTFIEMQNMLVTMGVLFVIVIATGETPSAKWFLIVPMLVLQTLFNAGAGLALARFGEKVLDFKQLLPFIMRTWMYMSGVMYSAKAFENHLPHWAARVMELNPMLTFVELGRYALIEKPQLTASPTHLWLIALGWSVVATIFGFLYFWRGEQEYGRG